jgi:hypothetical protein
MKSIDMAGDKKIFIHFYRNFELNYVDKKDIALMGYLVLFLWDFLMVTVDRGQKKHQAACIC